jgi:type IV secretory pathway component VirB8
MKKKTASKSSKATKAASSYHSAKQFDVNRLNQVTSVSKVLAAILFVALPFIAFMLGLMYQSSYQLLPY